jgi:hypothetical protein
MDLDTAVLLAMTACAYFWFISFGIREEKKEIKAREQEVINRKKREEHMKRLFGRS